jgi:hypothetical protein
VSRSLTVVLLLVLPAGAAGQTVLWGGYGQNTDEATGLATGENVTVGLGHFRSLDGLAAGLGLPVDPDASTRWGTLAGWFDRRLAASPWGVAGGATFFAFSDPVLERTGAGSVAALDAYHLLALAAAEVRFRVGARHGAHADGGADDDEATASSQRLLARAGTELGLRTGSLDLRAELDYWRAEEGGYTQAGARIGVVDRRIQAWAGASRWLADALPGTGWEVGARVPLAGRLALVARGGVQPPDILFQVPPQRSWSVALQVTTGAYAMAAALPVTVARDARHPVTFTLPADGIPGDRVAATPPGVAGTFTGWQILPMHRVDGRWEIALVLEPGVYEYSFVTAAGHWFVPPGTPGRKPDGFGGHVAVMIVQ